MGVLFEIQIEMPQLDKLTYFSQFFWLCLLLFTFYILLYNNNNGILGISRILKLRNQLLSHRGNKIQSKDPKNLEDISRKAFSTGLSYMYSSLSEVSQWCKTVDYFGKRRKITLISHLGEISGSRGMERQILYFLYLRIVLWQGFLFLCGLLLSIFFCIESAAAATGDIVMAHPPTSSSFSESPGELDALMDTTTAPSGEPSVNQPTPNPVEQEAQQALFQVRDEILNLYRQYILRYSPWMKKDITFLFGDDIQLQVESIVTHLELESLSTEELNEFLQDIRGNPNQLHSFFKEYWYGPN